jgi:hypothetical protein
MSAESNRSSLVCKLQLTTVEAKILHGSLLEMVQKTPQRLPMQRRVLAALAMRLDLEIKERGSVPLPKTTIRPSSKG